MNIIERKDYTVSSGSFSIMSVPEDRLNDLIHKGNKPLTVGIAWSIFGITICPCPLCLLGSLSFLTLGLADKFGLVQNMKQKMKDQPADCENCSEIK